MGAGRNVNPGTQENIKVGLHRRYARSADVASLHRRPDLHPFSAQGA